MQIIKALSLWLLLAAVAPALQAQTTESFTFTTNRVLPDGNAAGLSDVREVNSAIGVISSMQVRLKITGEFNGDLYGYLRHTNGFSVLLNRPGRSATNSYGYADSGFDVTFQDDAVNDDIHTYQFVLIPDPGTPLTGAWRPDGRTEDPAVVTDDDFAGNLLFVFNDLNATGEWALFLADMETGGTNMLTEWGLDITGSASPTLTWANPADIVYGTALSGTQLNATATYNATNVPGSFVYTPLAGTVLNVGAAQTLSVTFTPSDTTSFQAVSTSVVINVTPAPLTVTANDASKVYGAALPTFTAGYSGFVNGDDAADLDTQVTLSTTATSASPVATYAIVPSGAVDANYTITHVNGALTVTAAGLTITADDQTKVYGAALPTLTASYAGFVNGDDAADLDTPVTLSTTATSTSPVGPYTITASLAADANYSISFVTGELTVTAAALTITADDQTKVYGAALPTLTASYAGFVNGDDAADLDTPVTLSTTATSTSPVGPYTITASLAADANYSISFVTGELTVTAAALTITADDQTKVYGAALPTLTASYAGFVNGDDAADLDTPVTLSTTATNTSPVGPYTITASLAADANYSISFVTGELTVTAAALTITADDQTKVYGAALPTLTASYAGFVNGDDAADLDTPVTLSTTATSTSPVGPYTITASLAADANYSISFVTGELTVTAAALTITAEDKTKVYGAVLPTLTASYSGFVNGDAAVNLDTPVTLSTTATSTNAVGVYTITASGAVDANYSITHVNGTLTVTAAALTITAEDKTKVYGAALPTLTASYSGFVNGDAAVNLDTAVTLSTTATSTNAVGVYTITASGAVDANYSITHVNGTLTVTAAALTITAEDKTKVYGAALPTLTASYSGFVNGDAAVNLDTAVTLSTTATSTNAVGVYTITASGAVDANYSITHVNGTLTVTVAALTITAEDKTKVYGAALPTLTASYSGFVNGDTAPSLDTPVTLSTTATNASPVGVYTITATGAVDANYSITHVNGTLTVTVADLTITAENKTKVYGAALPTLTASYSGFVNGDAAVNLDTPVTLSTTATSTNAVGTYTITASGAVDANYTITHVDGTLTVTAAALTITADDKTKVYGATLPPLTASYGGFVNGDTAASLDTAVTLATTATSSSTAGTYPITATGAVDANYTITHVNGILTVTAAGLTVTADDQNKTYGQALPTLTANYAGFVNGDDTGDLTTLATITTTATAISDVGTYPITASGAVSTNYTFAYIEGTLTITKSLTTGALASSANPALPGASVTFTMTLSAVAPGAGTPTGSVSFRIDGTNAGSGTLTASAATYTRTNLTVGSHLVVAEYAGDLNFVGATNALAQNQVINTPPVAGGNTVERYPTQGVKVLLTTLLANDFDPDGDAVNLVSVSATSLNGGTVTVVESWVFYEPALNFTDADSFTYTIDDSLGATTLGTVTITILDDVAPGESLVITDLGGGSFLIRGSGIPLRTYRLQTTDTFAPPDWELVPGANLTADSEGEFEYTDTPGPGSHFYRTVYP